MVSGRKKRKSLEDLVDKQILYQLCIENKLISQSIELERMRVKRKMHRQYVV